MLGIALPGDFSDLGRAGKPAGGQLLFLPRTKF
jgi:hypothetical protein